MDCLFCKIINGELPANKVYDDDLVVAFDDIAPKAPHHKLIVPKVHIATLNDLDKNHNPLLGHMIHTASVIAKDLGVAENGYRTIFNCNKDAGQVVFHIHLHLLAGRPMPGMTQ